MEIYPNFTTSWRKTPQTRRCHGAVRWRAVVAQCSFVNLRMRWPANKKARHRIFRYVESSAGGGIRARRQPQAPTTVVHEACVAVRVAASARRHLRTARAQLPVTACFLTLRQKTRSAAAYTGSSHGSGSHRAGFRVGSLVPVTVPVPAGLPGVDPPSPPGPYR